MAKDFSFTAVQDSGSFMTGLYLSSHNLEVQANQIGGALKVRYFIDKNLEISPYIAIQQTELVDYDVFKSTMAMDSLITVDNKWTPAYFGGAYINYSVEKFNVNFNPYFYGKQKFDFGGGQIDYLKAGFIVNATMSYKFYENNQIYVTARNLFSGGKRQFAYADPVMPMVLVGVRVNL